MKSDRRPLRSPSWRLALLGLGALQFGCAASSVRLISYKDPYFPERVEVRLSDCAYWTDPGGDIHAAARAGSLVAGQAVTHYLHVHIFWHPRPGKTWADQTTTDALLRYVVVAPDGVLVYCGTGFALPRKKLGRELRIDLELARLKLDSRSGELADIFGDFRLSGTLHARHAPAAAANLIREAELAAAR